MNILIVDASAENRLALRTMVTEPGYTIVEASSRADALKELQKRDFAMLIIDLGMPGSGGFELAELVHASETTKSVPILFVTGQAPDADLVGRGYRAGAVDHLVKPLVAEIVRAKVAVFAEIYRQRMQIESSLREKEVLLREIHHRVKNNLQIISSLLSLQASRQSEDIRPLFIETNARVRSIALVHEQLHRADNFSAIDVNRYLTALTAGLLQTYGTLKTDLSVRATTTALTIDIAIPCGLIVNELVSNALKYAFPNDREGKIVVTLDEQPDALLLEVSDDGIGIPATIDTEHVSTMGLQLVRSLAHQLDGTVEIVRGKGTCIRIRFPKPH